MDQYFANNLRIKPDKFLMLMILLKKNRAVLFYLQGADNIYILIKIMTNQGISPSQHPFADP